MKYVGIDLHKKTIVVTASRSYSVAKTKRQFGNDHGPGASPIHSMAIFMHWGECSS